MTDYVMQLQTAMKQQSQDLRDELDDLKSWQSNVAKQSEQVKKKHASQKGGDIFSGSIVPPVRYTAAAAAAAAETNGGASSSSTSKSRRTDAEVVQECKERGNAYFSKSQFDDAARAYQQGLDADPTSSLCHVLHANRALCFLKLKQWDRADKEATEAISRNRTNAKAFFRRGMARKELGDLERAKADFDTCQVLVPGDADSQKELLIVNALIAEKAKNENKSSSSSSSSGAAKSASPKRKRLVIEEVDDDEDEEEVPINKNKKKQNETEKEKEGEEDDAPTAAEQKAKDDQLRREMAAAEERKAADRAAKIAKEEAARSKTRKANPRVEVVSEDDEDAVQTSGASSRQASPPASQPTDAAAAAAAAPTKKHADPQPAASSPSPAATAAATTAKTATTAPKKAATPSAPRAVSVQLYTKDNMPNPQNFSELERIFREIQNDAELVTALVKAVAGNRTDPAAIAQLFGANLTSEMFTAFVATAAQSLSGDDAALVGRVLLGLAKVRRIDDIVMFMDEKDTAFVKTALAKSGLGAAEKKEVEKKLL